MLIVTGMSGAGKTTAMATLEDIGYYCIDNIPSNTIISFLKLNKGKKGFEKVAIASDTRGGAMGSDLMATFKTLNKAETEYEILFLDATDSELVRRFKETRRKHPLLAEAEESLERVIEIEREIIAPVREMADIVIDTTYINITELKNRIYESFKDSRTENFFINLMSFGFKYGLPSDADLVFDIRCLPNPYYIPELKPKTGLDQEVRDYVLSFDEANILLDKLKDLIDFTLPLYKKEGKSQLVIAIGCTGGKHRSVTFVEKFCKHLNSNGNKIIITHRDIMR